MTDQGIQSERKLDSEGVWILQSISDFQYAWVLWRAVGFLSVRPLIQSRLLKTVQDFEAFAISEMLNSFRAFAISERRLRCTVVLGSLEEQVAFKVLEALEILGPFEVMWALIVLGD